MIRSIENRIKFACVFAAHSFGWLSFVDARIIERFIMNRRSAQRTSMVDRIKFACVLAAHFCGWLSFVDAGIIERFIMDKRSAQRTLRMSFLRQALKNLPQAAKSTYAFLAYLIVIIAWFIIAFQVTASQQLLEKIEKFPDEEKRDIILAETGRPVPPDLSPEQWLKSRRDSYYFYGVLSLCFAGTLVFAIAVTETKTTVSHQVKYDDDTIAFYKRAIDTAPNYAVAHFNLGNAYLRLGEYNLAIASHKRAIDINPNYTAAHNNLGIAYRRQGKYNLAIASYKRAIDIDPNYTFAYNNLGVTYYKQGEYNLAIASFKRAIDIDPNYTTAHNNLETAYEKQGNNKRVIIPEDEPQ